MKWEKIKERFIADYKNWLGWNEWRGNRNDWVSLNIAG